MFQSSSRTASGSLGAFFPRLNGCNFWMTVRRSGRIPQRLPGSLFDRQPGDLYRQGMRRPEKDLLARVKGVDGGADLPPLAPRSTPRGDRVRRSVPVGDGELPDEVIERGAEIMDDISDDGSPLFKGRLRFTVDEYLGSLPVVLGYDFVRTHTLGERLYLFVEELQVHIRPTYLGPTSTEVGLVGHD